MLKPLTSMRDRPSPRSLQLKVASDPANLAGVRKAVESYARTIGFDEKSIGEIGLCVNEAVANIIRPAYAGKTDRPVEIKADFERGRLVIALQDWGNGVGPTHLP